MAEEDFVRAAGKCSSTGLRYDDLLNGDGIGPAGGFSWIRLVEEEDRLSIFSFSESVRRLVAFSRSEKSSEAGSKSTGESGAEG